MIVKKIKKAVEKNPNKIAYKVNNDSITYDELWSCAYNYAQFLKRQDNTPVIIYGHKDIYVVISILACLIANRTYVPVGLCTPLYRIKKIVNITKSTLIITDENISIDNVDCCSLKDLEKYKDNAIKDCNSDIAYMIFTSGSTGEPKGVPISKKNLNNFIDWICNLKPLDTYENINVLNQASFSFDLSVADFYYSICNGNTLIAYDSDTQEEYDKLFDLFKNDKITVAVMTPTFMKLCLINDEFKEENYPDFKCVYFCGELLENKTVKLIFEKFPNLQIINAYGPTEATSAVSGILITKEILEKEELLPVGEVNTFATQIEIINDEIVLKGDSVFGGYLGDYIGGFYKERNVNCYRTGDIGFIKNNKLYCKGRLDNQIKFKGYRIELSDIEYNINQISGVKECAVVAKYNDNGVVKTVKAFVTVESGVDVEYIKNNLRSRIPGYMMPKTIKIIDKLPINQNGKIDRKVLSSI